MCIGIPGQVVEPLTYGVDLATVEVKGVRRPINVGLIEEQLRPGDWVLIHMGFAMSTMEEQEAKSALEFLESMGQAYEDEVAALLESTAE